MARPEHTHAGARPYDLLNLPDRFRMMHAGRMERDISGPVALLIAHRVRSRDALVREKMRDGSSSVGSRRLERHVGACSRPPPTNIRGLESSITRARGRGTS